MKKITRRDFNKLMNQVQLSNSIIEEMKPIDVFHTHNWDHNIMHWDEDNLRNENPPLREFYFDLKEMLIFIRNYLNELIFKEAILASKYGGRFIGIPYDENYKHCVEEITKWLHMHNMRVNSSDGLLVNKVELINCIDIISESGFMGMSGLCVFIPDAGIIIDIHHHMNYLIYAKDKNFQKTIIRGITDLQDNIKMY